MAYKWHRSHLSCIKYKQYRPVCPSGNPLLLQMRRRSFAPSSFKCRLRRYGIWKWCHRFHVEMKKFRRNCLTRYKAFSSQLYPSARFVNRAYASLFYFSYNCAISRNVMTIILAIENALLRIGGLSTFHIFICAFECVSRFTVIGIDRNPIGIKSNCTGTLADVKEWSRGGLAVAEDRMIRAGAGTSSVICESVHVANCTHEYSKREWSP